jgi:hypothetical protein
MGEACDNRVRAWSAVVLAGCVGILGVAAWLEPDPHGYGTHRQMGLATCSWVAGRRGPCPTCGMTTAFSLAAHGRLVESFAAQPAAALGALMVAMTAWISGYGLVTGCPAVRRLKVLATPRMWLVVLAVLMAGWGWKIAFG